MADESSRELTLYVQSKKAVTSFYRPPSPSGAGRASDPTLPSAVGAVEVSHAARGGEDEVRTGEEVYFLSDDQARCLAFTEEQAARRRYKLKVVDVGKAGRLEQFVVEHLRNVQNFPVLIGPQNQRLEGPEAFTEDRLSELMPTEMERLRAFSYLKVRGGNLDRIREMLVTFPQVKELHFLTGDWDIFVVLEFPAGETKKRQILDFVTENIRGINDVLDTSTLVPEYSVTKFPIG